MVGNDKNQDRVRTSPRVADAERPGESAVLGSALIVLGVMMIDAPVGVFGILVRGYFLLVGLCLLLRAFTMRKAPRFDQVLSNMLVIVSLTALAAVVLAALIAGIRRGGF